MSTQISMGVVRSFTHAFFFLNESGSLGNSRKQSKIEFLREQEVTFLRLLGTVLPIDGWNLGFPTLRSEVARNNSNHWVIEGLCFMKLSSKNVMIDNCRASRELSLHWYVSIIQIYFTRRSKMMAGLDTFFHDLN